jgi:cytochrome P450
MAAHMGGSLLFSDPPDHTRLRSFAAKAFSPPVVRRFESWVRELCVGIADRVGTIEGEFDAVTHISSALPGQVICSILGVPEADRKWMVDTIFRAFSEFDPSIGPEGQRDAAASLLKYALHLRELKLREPGEDMATELASADGNGQPLNDNEYIQMVHTIASAGFETTHTLIAQSLIMMSRDAIIRNALNTTDRQQLSPVIDELVRLITPTMYFGRNVTEDTELRGTKLAKGDFVIMWFAAANRDPTVFEDPHQFKVDRARRNHVAFGAGSPHFCIGNGLAKLEVELLFQEFAKRELKLDLIGVPKRLPHLLINGIRKLPMVVVRQ